MKEKQLLETKEINIEDWEATPVKVKDLVVQQREEIEKLEQRLKELEVKIGHLQEKVNRNSENSHSPSSSDFVKLEGKKQKRKKTRCLQKRLMNCLNS